jgi:hypothetical protein
VTSCACYNQPYESPGWFQYVTRRDTSLGTLSGAYPFGLTTQNTTRHFYDASVSYVTGTHNIKAGIQDQRGFETFAYDKNGDLELNYVNGVPSSVTIFNTSLHYQNNMDHIWGVYAQDSWKMNQMTISYGVRYEDIRTSIPEQEIGPGRFVGARKYNGDKMPTYKSWNPRLGAVYDLFGDGKTAIKFSANKHEAPLYDALTNGFNPIRSQTASPTWNDLNNDGIALENEMNSLRSQQLRRRDAGLLVLATAGATPCGRPDRPEPEARQFMALWSGRAAEVFPGATVSFNWYHTTFGELLLTTNTLQTFADYTPVTIASPLTAAPSRFTT